MKKSVTIQFRLEECVASKLRELVSLEGASVTSVIEAGIWNYIKEKEPKSVKSLQKKVEAAYALNRKRGRPKKAS